MQVFGGLLLIAFFVGIGIFAGVCIGWMTDLRDPPPSPDTEAGRQKRESIKILRWATILLIATAVVVTIGLLSRL